MIHGSCHCGAVAFEIDGPLKGVTHCHCHTCRKITGTAFNSGAAVDAGHFRVRRGAEALTGYESSPGKRRYFCSRCGSPIYAQTEANPKLIMLRLGGLDDDPGIRSARHIWTSHAAPWYADSAELPRFPEAPPG